MEDFTKMPKGLWGASAVSSPEFAKEQARKTAEVRKMMDNAVDSIKYRDAFPKDYVLPATGTEGLVCDDIAARQKLGTAKYGTTVCANPLELRAWLQHAYEECLDQAIYLKRAIQEIDNGKGL
jgi:hypothetical protein